MVTSSQLRDVPKGNAIPPSSRNRGADDAEHEGTAPVNLVVRSCPTPPDHPELGFCPLSAPGR